MILALLLASLGAPAEPASSYPPADERSIDALVPAGVLERLLAGEEVTHTLWGSRSLELIPEKTIGPSCAGQPDNQDQRWYRDGGKKVHGQRSGIGPRSRPTPRSGPSPGLSWQPAEPEDTRRES